MLSTETPITGDRGNYSMSIDGFQWKPYFLHLSKIKTCLLLPLRSVQNTFRQSLATKSAITLDNNRGEKCSRDRAATGHLLGKTFGEIFGKNTFAILKIQYRYFGL
jgi:hypothetical protein